MGGGNTQDLSASEPSGLYKRDCHQHYLLG